MPPAAPTAFHLDPALLQRLKGIELRSRFLVRGLYDSRHRTADFGSSTEFIEHREYRRGDELRRVDWRVYGRTDRLFVKVHEMEANMRVHLVLDTSDSMRVPPPEGLPSKLDLAAVIAGAIATLAQGQQDSAGLLCVGDKVEAHIPARQGQAHLLQLYQRLERPPGRGGGRFAELVLDSIGRLGTRGLVFLLTDALDDPDALASALANLRLREQDTTLIQILDRREVEFPFDQLTEFRHPESGRRIIGDPAALRDRYLERLAAFEARLVDLCKRTQTDYLRLHNHDDLAPLLTLHFLRRYLEAER
jgi:uncharacterized protein (DUF58 family)